MFHHVKLTSFSRLENKLEHHWFWQLHVTCFCTTLSKCLGGNVTTSYYFPVTYWINFFTRISHMLILFDNCLKIDVSTKVSNLTSKVIDCILNFPYHYNGVMMSAMASQITSITSVYSGTDQRKHHKGPVTRKMFPFDDVIMNMHAVCFTLFCHCCCLSILYDLCDLIYGCSTRAIRW